MGAFFPLDSHFMVYFITLEMHVFSHWFPITWEKTAKTIEWGKFGKLVPCNILNIKIPLYVENLGNWYSYFSHSVGAFFPLDSYFMVYFIIYEIYGFPLQFPIAQENAGKSIELGEPRKLVPVFSLSYGCFSSIRLPFMVYFVTTGEMHGFSHQNPLCELSGYFSTVLLILLVPKSIDSIKEKTKNSIRYTPFFFKKKRKTSSRHAGIQSKIYQKKKSERI